MTLEWKYNDVPNNSPYLCGYEYQSAFEFHMTLVNTGPDPCHNVCFFTDAEYAGWLGLRLDSSEYYRPILTTSDQAFGYIGTVPVGETVVYFQFENATEANRTFFVVPVYVADDDMISEPNRAWSLTYPDDVWAHCYAQQVFWRSWYFDTIPSCDGAESFTGGFSANEEPQLFEDSGTPDLWS